MVRSRCFTQAARFFALALLLLTLAASRSAFAAQTSLTWYGQSAFKLTTPSGKVLLIDPWITNPVNPNGKADVAALTHVDLILISHGHFDHIGDSVAIAKATGAKLVATGDLAGALVAYAGYPKDQAGMDTQGNFGGSLSLLDGEVEITFIPAIHSSAVTPPAGDDHGLGPQYGGSPGGFLIQVKNGPTIYHTGDTDVFSDMSLIPHHHKVDVMLACIGGHYTMGPEGAADAVKLVNPGVVIPMHFGTFPALAGTPAEFDAALKARGVKTKLQTLKVGDTIELK
ncbi:UPF0173 metal-dependent hydrolase [Capsulimonas corticalis]|uniref:UPF0173 metal-dependent hydrolase CCAX7_11200 n=1 Tax=Capsulimonas corticalis TaxID=2219043 RepID=A0A402CUR7_9BACT|nr:metal-dependent hydrolase [Capsulimonas corticalis]BDI29069.1 UPF0173 metal-dependent hydrolase [Capsulimonas corticalis]